MFLLDEPTADLDPAAAHAIMALLRRTAQSGRTVVTVLHALDLATRYADRMLVVGDGRILADAAPLEALPVAAQAFGLPWGADDAPPAAAPPGAMRWSLPASLALHLAAIALAFLGLAPRPAPAPPKDPVGVQVVMGDAGLEAGSPAAPPAPEPPPAPTHAPTRPAARAPPPAPATPPAPEAPPPPPPDPAAPLAHPPAPAPPPAPPAPRRHRPHPGRPRPPSRPRRHPRPTPAPAPEVRLGPLETGFSRVQDPERIVTQAQPGKGNLPPLYPRESERRGEQGTVVLRVRVDAAGNATQVDVIESSGYPALDAAARARLATWRFQPGRREDGTAAPDVIEIGINFQLH